MGNHCACGRVPFSSISPAAKWMISPPSNDGRLPHGEKKERKIQENAGKRKKRDIRYEILQPWRVQLARKYIVCCWARTDLTPVLSFPRQIGIWLLQRFYCGSHARIWEAVKGCNNISAWLSASAPLCDGAEREPHILNSLIYGRMAYTSETHSCTHIFFLKKT